MADLPESERREILLELQTMKAKDVREKHNISNLVVSHLRWHCQHLLVGVNSPKDRVQELRTQGYNSIEVAEITGIPLEKVNSLWSPKGL